MKDRCKALNDGGRGWQCARKGKHQLGGKLYCHKHYQIYRLKMLEGERVPLRASLLRMVKLHGLMMKQVNHNEAAYDANCIKEMNEAPPEATKILTQGMDADEARLILL